MGYRFRKSVKAGPLRVNFSKSGVGYSIGTKGFRYTKKAGGGTRTTASVPGTGISYVKETGKKSTKKAVSQGKNVSTIQNEKAAAAINDSKRWQYKVARILALIFGIPTCIFAVLCLLCGEFLAFAIFGIIGVLFLFLAKQYKKRLANTTSQTPLKNQTIEPFLPSAHEITQSNGASTDIIAPATTETMRETVSTAANMQKESPFSVEKTYRVAGTTFHSDSIMNLAIENSDYDCTKKELIDDDRINERVWKYEFDPSNVELVPEPDNPEDSNAIKVTVDGEHIGYIKSGSCAHLHKMLRENRILNISCEIGGGPYKYISEEYDEEKDKDVYVLERSKTNFFAVLTVQELRDK